MSEDGGHPEDSDLPIERRKHFRGRARPGRRIEIKFRERARDEPHQVATTRNIGVGGAFIVTDWRAPIGTPLELVVAIPGNESDLQVNAEVRWIADGQGDTKGGVGVKFVELDVNSLLALSEYFAALGPPSDSGT